MTIMNNPVEPERITSNGDIIKGASHTCRVLNHKERNKMIIKAVCDLRKIESSFDSIACCGSSGLMVVPQIAELLDKNIVLVRKPNEKCYSDFTIEGVKPYRYIIVDDLICSGDTIRNITRAIQYEYEHSICIGLYCYMPEECSYNKQTSHIFERRFKTSLLNI